MRARSGRCASLSALEEDSRRGVPIPAPAAAAFVVIERGSEAPPEHPGRGQPEGRLLAFAGWFVGVVSAVSAYGYSDVGSFLTFAVLRAT